MGESLIGTNSLCLVSGPVHVMKELLHTVPPFSLSFLAWPAQIPPCVYQLGTHLLVVQVFEHQVVSALYQCPAIFAGWGLIAP